MDVVDVWYNKQDYIETTIIQSESIIRGDLANPPWPHPYRACLCYGIVKLFSGRPLIKPVAFFPLQIGDHVFIGEGSVVNAGHVGSFVYIGKNCVIGRRSVLKDCCMIEDNTVLAPETVVPAFAIFSGSPGLFSGELPECTQDLMTDFTKAYYHHFKPSDNTAS
ncbi:hypothetical protein HPB48_025802 [Haemaphysalis longicornis]|uniref:Dynactin subunit 5 n=1 Tax=Haemaphysalis longicornis TaxID=44386 RepID=A0A9J6H885_HAELO|nr:hypothetical protein HPB48_025802 [Haemaphysalis longicornis]